MPETFLTIGLVVMTGLAIAAAAWGLALRAGSARLREAVDQRDATLIEKDAALAEADAKAEGYRAEVLDLGERLKRAEVGVAELTERERGFDKRLADQQQAFDQRLEDQAKAAAEARSQAEQAFKALAGDQLKAASEQFVTLAKKTFEGEQKDAAAQLEQRKQAVEQLIKPIREALDKQESAFKSMDLRHREAHGGLTEQVRGLLDAQHRLSDTTSNLVTALRRPEVRGRWGEMQLRRVAEVAGMIAHCDFDEQVSLADGRRPDMVVRLPAERSIVVDAKNTIDAYLSALESGSDDEREQHMGDHVVQLEQQVGALATKSYQAQFERSPDFVVLFVPVESALQAALERKPGLMESAMTRGVVIATPSTLIALLKAVAMGWREERVAENAQRISQLGQELHERIATLVEHFEKLGRTIEGSVKAYNQAVGSLESRVLVTTRKFKDLGADSSKELPAEAALGSVETTVREMKAIEAD
ncbi:MAG: DNA recombination protein RmuC [Planctomycetota bacterium]